MFDKYINRYNTKSIKYDSKKKRGIPDEAYPLWVADMDFSAPIVVLDKLKEHVNHGIFGYTEPDDSYNSALINWMNNRHNLVIDKSWVIQTPGVVYALALCIQAYTSVNEGVLIQTPVYYPFYEVIRDNERKIITSSLIEIDNKYTIDFEDLEYKFKTKNVKMMILCNPHNPVGRSWEKAELEKISFLSDKYNVLVVSDEIHMDIVFEPSIHISYPNVAASDRWIVCTSASKSFNLAGLQLSNIIIKDKQLKEEFILQLRRSGYSQPNTLGLIATEAAYSKGENWLIELKKYIYCNYIYLQEFFVINEIDIGVSPLEATYLVWLDFRNLFTDYDRLNDFILNNAKLWLDDGRMFGVEGSGFQRINIALSRNELIKVLNQLKEALIKFEALK